MSWLFKKNFEDIFCKNNMANARAKKFKSLKKNYKLIIRENTTDKDVFYQVIVDQSYYVDENTMQPKIIVDLGANVGYSAVYFARKFPRAQIYSLEPDKGNFEVLKKNTADYPNIHILNGAVYSETRMISVMDSKQGEWARMVSEEESNMNEQVQAYSMDDLFREWGLAKDRIDIIKIDIEGSEKELFEANTDWLNKVGLIFIETHDRFKPGSSSSVFRTMLNYDFQLDVKGDNLIFSNISKLK